MITDPSTAKSVVITIDGPAGAGKSTIARQLARRLKFSYLDTGAMYRALTLKALKQKVPLTEEAALVSLARQTKIDLQTDEKQMSKVFLDGCDVTTDIRSIEVTNNTFYIARVGGVREIMVEWQRAIGQKSNIVVEGRDAGTVIFPKATKKFYLDANLEERARRRIKELRLQGKEIDGKLIKLDLRERDIKDLTRKVGPLKKAKDAIVVDTTDLSIDEVVLKLFVIINKELSQSYEQISHPQFFHHRPHRSRKIHAR